MNAPSLAEQYPTLAQEWHPTKNKGMTLNQFTSGSGKKVWWQCPLGHEWETQLFTRTKGANCPYCSNQKVLKGFNDLATTHPEIAKQWHPELNGEIAPDQISAGTAKKFWWQCEQGHHWEASVRLRTKQNTGCPYCSNQKVWIGYNDLATTDPDLTNYWHNELNHPLTPQMVTRGSGKKVWWICKNNHVWKRPIHDQTNNSSCPICSDKPICGHSVRPEIKHQKLSDTHPELIQELHPTKNVGLTISSIASHSKQKVWWLGTCGHEWESDVRIRTKGKAGCPYCSNQKLLSGFNDLATTYPLLSKEWHPTKNGDLTPESIIIGHNINAWWLGECGHGWQAAILSRIKGSTCPYCSNRKVLEHFNDLATTHPDLTKEWHPTKNGNLTPNQVVAGSKKEVWWQCGQGHEWQASIFNRTKNWGNCPQCSSVSIKEFSNKKNI